MTSNLFGLRDGHFSVAMGFLVEYFSKIGIFYLYATGLSKTLLGSSLKVALALS